MKPKPTQGSDIERLFYLERSYNQIFESLAAWVAEHFSAMELDYARIKFPDTATLLSMELKYATDIAVAEDTILFDAVVACENELSQDGKICPHDQWFRAPCEITVEDKIKSVSVGTIQVYERTNRKNKIWKVDADLVPMICKKNLDDEATRFLERYYPQALESVMPVPIADIVENIMGLKLLMGGKLSGDFSTFGQICFSSGRVDLFDIWDGTVTSTEVERGTIVIDSSTYWERNLGCVNNTIAHEAFHWHRHRVYAAVQSILKGEKFIAHRCPAKSKRAYNSEENAEWSAIERMEWQADHVAPRILMPIQTVRPYIESLYEIYGFHQNPNERKLILECVISDLAEMYKVSKLSAKIRMLDLGYTEANEVYNYEEANAPFFNTVSSRDAFYEYCDNEDFRKIVDSGMFVYVGGHFVINHEKYIVVGDDDELSLTDYAYNNFTECTLQFTYRRVNMERHGRFHTDIFHRGNHAAYEQLPHYDTNRNYPVYELASKVAEFEEQYAVHKDVTQTFWERAYQLMQKKKWNSSIFCDKTLLNEITFSRCKNNYDSNPDMRTVIAICAGLDLDIQLTTELLRLAGHTLTNTREHQAFGYAITGFKGKPIYERNAFLEELGFAPLGSKQRK